MVLLSLTRDYNISPSANRLALGRSGNQAHGSEKNSVFRPDRRAWATSHSALMSLADVPIQRKVQALPRFEFDGASDAERDTYRGTERSLVKSENAVRPSVQQKTGVQATVCLHNPLLPGIRPQNLQARGVCMALRGEFRQFHVQADGLCRSGSPSIWVCPVPSLFTVVGEFKQCAVQP